MKKMATNKEDSIFSSKKGSVFSMFPKHLSPLGDWEEDIEKYKIEEDLFVTEILGQQEVEIGNFYVFTASKFSRSNFDFDKITSKIKWGFATNDSGITEIYSKMKIGNSITWQIPDIKNETLKLYAWLDGSNRRSSLEIDLLNNRAKYLTYYIYWNNDKEGKIERLVPKKIDVINQSKVQFIYVSAKNVHYNLATVKFIQNQKFDKKNVLSPVNGNATFLVDIREITTYLSNDINFRFATLNSEESRWYINPDCLSGLIGAMIENNITDLGFNGFSTVDGGSGSSKTHINGTRGDLRYLSKNFNGEKTLLEMENFDYERQILFNKSLHKFFWGRTEDMLSERQSSKTPQMLPYCKHLDNPRHNNHLHIQGFDFSKIVHISKKTL